jgi:chaperonin GroES|tara:strand:- start:487 stop:798 length:312 start_codon:yes stop_codon:yes gene_type:complete
MIIPFDARVVVKKPKRQEQTASGIILPDSADDGKQTDKGEVVAVGPGSRYVGGDRIGTGERMEIPVKVGQTILYSKFQGVEVKHNDEDFFIVMERDIIAVIEE